mgnify:CR=1 FL=1
MTPDELVKRLFDCLSGLWCCTLGHCNPRVAEAIGRQVGALRSRAGGDHAAVHAAFVSDLRRLKRLPRA